ncbi:MAG: molybdopterin-dependent oxidoreductase [Alphaproteobacteria bacterium]
MSRDEDEDGPPTPPGADPRIVAARLRLRERFLDRTSATPSLSDPSPMGKGAPNRHGMPKLPPGQTATAPGKWPVLDLGITPELTRETWTLRVDGACENPLVLEWAALLALEQVDDESDFHCVTGWSKLDVRWRGVRFGTICALARPHEEAAHVLCHGHDGYSTNLPLAEALKDDVLLVHAVDGAPLPLEHGGPVRVVTPQLWAWKGAKWIARIEILVDDRPGFWERNGYSNTAHPWRDDRYARLR